MIAKDYVNEAEPVYVENMDVILDHIDKIEEGGGNYLILGIIMEILL